MMAMIAISIFLSGLFITDSLDKIAEAIKNNSPKDGMPISTKEPHDDW